MTQRQVREPCIEPSNAPEKKSVSQTAAYHPDNRGGGGSLSTRHHYIFCLSMLEPETLDQTQRFYPVFSGSIDAYLHRRRVLAQRIEETTQRPVCIEQFAAFSEKAQRFSEKASVCGDLMGKLFLQWLIYKGYKYLTIYFFLRKRSEHLNSPPPRHC